MPTQIGNFIAQNFRATRPADVERDRYSNALLQNQVDRLPQMNKAQDLEIQAAEQNMGQSRMAGARKMAADMLAAVAESPDPIGMGATLFRSPMFREAGAAAGLPVDQFAPGPGDDPEKIRAAARAWAQAVGATGVGGSGAKYGVTPQFGVDAQGNPVPIQFNDQGGAQVTKLPDGVTISRTPIRMDAGTEWVILDPITRQVVSREPKNIEGQNAAEQIGDWLGKSYSEIQTAGMSAGQSLARLDRLESLASQIETGRLAGAKKTISEYAQALGIDVEGLDEAQAFQALTNQLALEMRNPSGGAGMPGAMSDQDREFLMRTVPNLLNTPGGNKQIIAFARALAQRNQQVAARAREYKRRTGRMDEGFFGELAQWSSSTPMFNQGPAQGGGSDINQLLDKYAPRTR